MSARCFRPEIMRDLELPKHGLQIIPYEGGAVFTQDGDYLANYRDHDANRREFARFSPRDAEAYDRYSRDVMRQCRFIRPLLMRTPPDPTSFRRATCRNCSSSAASSSTCRKTRCTT